MATKTPKPKIKSVSFKHRNFNCYEYIKDLDNFSDYVCDLIKLDMEYGLLKNRYALPNPQIVKPEIVEPKQSEPEQVEVEPEVVETEKVEVEPEVVETEKVIEPEIVESKENEQEIELISEELLDNFGDFIN